MPAGGALWRFEPWHAQATAFVDETLAARGLHRTGLLETVRVQPWSANLRFCYSGRSDGGGWYKANVAPNRFEADLISALAEHDADRVAPHWAANDAGEFISPDYGPVLGEVVAAENLRARWAAVLTRYAELQVSVAQAGLVLPAPSYAPLAIADEFDSRTDDLVARDVVRAAASRLASGPVPLSIQHDDLHQWNVFLAADTAEAVDTARFYDWGDSHFGHPFASTQVGLDQFDDDLTWPVGPEHKELLTAYLLPWRAYADDATLRSLVNDALLVVPVSRALSWERALVDLDPAETEWAQRPGQWLQMAIDRAHTAAATPGGH